MINARTTSGVTALAFAARKGFTEVVTTLMAAGAGNRRCVGKRGRGWVWKRGWCLLSGLLWIWPHASQSISVRCFLAVDRNADLALAVADGVKSLLSSIAVLEDGTARLQLFDALADAGSMVALFFVGFGEWGRVIEWLLISVCILYLTKSLQPHRLLHQSHTHTHTHTHTRT